MKLRPLSALLAALVLGFSACSREEEQPAAAGADQVGGVLNLYTARHYDADAQLYDGFERRTGVRVRAISNKAELLVERMRAEGASSPADVVLMADAGALWRAQEAGLLQPVQSAVLDGAIPTELRDPERRWWGFARRARVIVYARDAVPSGSEGGYADLADPRLRSRVCVRSSDNVYNLSTMAALIELWGRPQALEWARGVVRNMARPPQGGDVDQIKAVAAGACDAALVNSYYYIRLARSEDPAERQAAQRTVMVFPQQAGPSATPPGGAGTLVNISGGGVARHAPNRANAVAFLEYLATPEAQAILAQANNEYPAAKGAPVPEALRPYAGFKAAPLPVAVYGRRQAEAQAVFDEAGWR
jgi:iron(III) transport system substrate-binding protein